MHAERKDTVCSHKHSFTPFPPLLALTDGQNDGWRNKYTRCAWAGGTFFPVVLLCHFLFLREIGFGFTYLRTFLKKLCYKLIISNSCWSISNVFWRALKFKKILIGFLCFTETIRSKLSVTVYLFLALYGSTTFQSWSFFKYIENFLCK
jgi:hypothetical protein